MFFRKSFFSKLVLLLFVLALFSPLASAQTFEAIKNQVKTHVLPNGMKFIVLERHDAPVVSFHVYADVGSANESYGITGVSHILEHMAFKGTKTVGTKDYAAEAKVLDEVDSAYLEMKREEAKANPDAAKIDELKKKFIELEKKAKEYVVNNEYFDMMMREGDRGVNAYTSNDATQYINSLPSNRLEFWMAMTSDRFLNPVFREFYKERDVIMEERRLGLETQPTGKLMEDFMAVAFKAHPYHHVVVGHMSDLQSITRKDVEEYFKKFYSPSNLTAGIVGDVKAEEVFKLANTYFGRIPSGRDPSPSGPKSRSSGGRGASPSPLSPSPTSSWAIISRTPSTRTAGLWRPWPTSSGRGVPRGSTRRSSRTKRSPSWRRVPAVFPATSSRTFSFSWS